MFSGIAKIKNMLAARPPKILIFSSCVNLIRELKSYAWAEGDRPKKFDDHALDELRYFVMSGALPQAVKPQKPKYKRTSRASSNYKKEQTMNNISKNSRLL